MATPLNASILKSFEILGLFSQQRSEITTATVVDNTSMNNATAHRFLLSLLAAGALHSTRRGVFTLGPAMAELGQLAGNSNPLPDLVKAELPSLSQALNESVMACRLSAQGPVCIAVANCERPISVNIRVGTTLPLLGTAQGKLWLASMEPDARRQKLKSLASNSSQRLGGKQLKSLEQELLSISKHGYATNLGENEPDIAAVCMPVHDSGGTMLLSLSVFGMKSRFNEKLIARARRELKAVVSRVEAEMLRSSM